MTSGNFTSVPTSSIIVDRDSRQRRELQGIDELAKSIAATGLINPPVVTRDLILVAGERRLTACKQLGWDMVSVQFAEDLSADALYLIELEENVKRLDLDWKDQVAAVANYHRMRAKTEQSWTASATARALNISPGEVAEKIQVFDALDRGEKLVVEAPRYSVARGVVARQQQRKKTSEVDRFTAEVASPLPTSVVFTPTEVDDLTDVALPSATPVPFIHADFIEWAATYSGPRFNFIHCDFPYGVNAQSHNQGAAASFGSYADSADVYWKLLDALSDAMANVVAESAHLMFWFSLDYYHETKVRLEQMGWKVNPFPLIWHKNDNSGILPDPKRGPRRIYETAFLCTRGDRFIVQAVSNLFSAPNSKEIHMSEKNKDMLQHFFRMFVDDSTLMLDPTMGSGNAVVVAQDMAAHTVLGLERDETFFDNAVAAYRELK